MIAGRLVLLVQLTLWSLIGGILGQCLDAAESGRAFTNYGSCAQAKATEQK